MEMHSGCALLRSGWPAGAAFRLCWPGRCAPYTHRWSAGCPHGRAGLAQSLFAVVAAFASLPSAAGRCAASPVAGLARQVGVANRPHAALRHSESGCSAGW